jgi:hypothetical protein
MATPQVLLSPNHKNLQPRKKSPAPKHSAYSTTAIDFPAKEIQNLLTRQVNGNIPKHPISHQELPFPFQEYRLRISRDLDLGNLAKMVIGKLKVICLSRWEREGR